MQMRDWFFHSKELALFPGDIPLLNPLASSFPGVQLPSRWGLIFFCPGHFLGSQPQLPTVLITAPGVKERKKVVVFAHLTTLNRTF